MLKYLVAAAALFAGVLACPAQVKYQGHVGAGYAVGVGATGAGHLDVETVHGVRVNHYFFGGAGAGLNYYPSEGTINGHF